MSYKTVLSLLLFVAIIFTTVAGAQSGYEVRPHTSVNSSYNDTGADVKTWFSDLPMWVKISYISASLIGIIALIKIIPIVFSKIEDILISKKRVEILQYIEKNPGQTLADLSNVQNMKRGTIVYHLLKLESMGKVTLKRIGKFTRVFRTTNKYDDVDNTILQYIKTPTSKLLLVAILQNPGITSYELVSKLELNRSTVHWYGAVAELDSKYLGI